MAEPDQKNAPQGGGDEGSSSQGPQEDALLARLRAAAGGGGGHPTPMTCLVGILGTGARPGYWTLYLGLDMSRYVEIRAEDIVLSEALPPDQSPFGSLGGTRVCVKKGASLDYSRTLSQSVPAEALGGTEFDLDVRLGSRRARPAMAIPATQDTQCCFPDTFGTECGGGTGAGQTCLTCRSCGDTCFRTCNDTCRTQCDTCPGDTCFRTCNDTCATQCGTCQTCATQCGTCQTCATQCGTCQTCQTCLTRCGDCQPTEQTCPGDTCRACTHVTCFNTCGC